MAYCPSCGSSVEGRFCAKCGTAVAAPPASAPASPPPPAYGAGASPPPPGYGAQPPYTPPPPPPGYGAQGPYAPPPPGYQQQSAGMQENVAAALCYVLGWITGIVFLVLAPYNQNRNIKFHAWQSIFFFGGATVLSILLSIISGVILASLSFGLWSIFRLIYLIFDLAVLACWLLLMFKAYNNQRFVLPVVGPLAEKQANS